jgi:hypothetical protein
MENTNKINSLVILYVINTMNSVREKGTIPEL